MILLQSEKRQSWAAMLLLMAGAYLLFANTFGNAWTYDDFPVIVQNPDIRSFAGFLRNSYPGRPLREITYLLDHALFGLKPAGWHIQQIFWHGLNAGLLYVLVRRLKGSFATAWIASLLFLAHPIQVEVVANISHRKDSLALAFSLLSLLMYVSACEGRRTRRLWWLLGALGAGAVAYSAKQNAIVLPVVFLAYEQAYLRAEERILLRYKKVLATLFAAAGIGVLCWFFLSGAMKERYWEIQGILSKLDYLSGADEGVYLAAVLKSWVFMFLKLLWPFDLGVEYTYGVPASWFDPWVVAAIAGICLYAFLLWIARRRRPMIFLSLAWVGAYWLPTSNLFLPLTYLSADRYLYAPSVGFFILAGIVLGRVLAHKRVVGGVVAASLVAVLSTLTWQQNRVWSSPLALWTNAVKVSPSSSYALTYLGTVYLNEGEAFKAIPLLRKAAKINPYNFAAKERLRAATGRIKR